MQIKFLHRYISFQNENDVSLHNNPAQVKNNNFDLTIIYYMFPPPFRILLLGASPERMKRFSPIPTPSMLFVIFLMPEFYAFTLCKPLLQAGFAESNRSFPKPRKRDLVCLDQIVNGSDRQLEKVRNFFSC
jgi:hypothetical protein